ncbi:MAG TPA: zf-HC2 domain-containing protein [Burkholderiaceae bacterium]|nr:zf-HC2 domain-containing protein [Burkholderiaceae bacterium]
MTKWCPNPDDLSAYLDGELPADLRARTAAHLKTCAACAARHAEFQALRADFAALPDERLGFDLSQVVRGRIDALPARPRGRHTPRWHVANWRGLLPIGAAAVASLSLGLALGTSLIAPAAIAPATGLLEVFAPVAPGGLCSGLGSCWRPTAITRQIP